MAAPIAGVRFVPGGDTAPTVSQPSPNATAGTISANGNPIRPSCPITSDASSSGTWTVAARSANPRYTNALTHGRDTAGRGWSRSAASDCTSAALEARSVFESLPGTDVGAGRLI